MTPSQRKMTPEYFLFRFKGYEKLWPKANTLLVFKDVLPAHEQRATAGGSGSESKLALLSISHQTIVWEAF